MTVFTLTIDPMPALRADAKLKIDRAFNQAAVGSAHLDAAYAAKREIARRVADGDAAAAEALQDEAALRGVTAAALAADILTKPDTLADREARRQVALSEIRQASTPDDLKAVLGKYGASMGFAG
ncbi:hypothetical protein [Rhodopseudomonas telluris]|uniref:Uncharacterized protein n=1 Tax=Rhodopseudomonas telluris TaxID=644215 RepID=A0ABV6EZN0_9BRAD